MGEKTFFVSLPLPTLLPSHCEKQMRTIDEMMLLFRTISSLGTNSRGIDLIKMSKIKELNTWLDITHPSKQLLNEKLKNWLNVEKGEKAINNLDDWAYISHRNLVKTNYQLWPEEVEVTRAPVFDQNWQFYTDLLPDGGKKQLVTDMEKFLDNIDWSKGRQHVISRMKEITALAKTGQDKFHLKWKYFVDWDQLCGYNIHSSDITSSEVVSKVLDWGTKPTLDRSKILVDYAKKLRDVMWTMMMENKPFVGEFPTFETWLNNPDNWVTSGSSRGVSSTVNTPEGVLVQSAKNKTAVAVERSIEQVKHDLFNPAIVENAYPSIKIELGGRNRIIVMMGFILNTRLAYPMDWIAKCMSMNTSIQLYASNETKLKWLIERSADLRIRISLPIDDQDYDQNVSRDEMDAFIDTIAIYIRNFALPSYKHDMLTLWLLAKEQLWATPIVINGKEIAPNWKKGMPSGIKYTALGDSFINVARQRLVANEINKSLYNHVMIDKLVGWGDDADQQHANWLTPLLTLVWFERLGYKPHPAKNFISTECTEWLRRVIEKRKTAGYPARGIVKMMLRNPQSGQGVHNYAALIALIDQCSIAFGRLEKSTACWKFLVNTIHDKLTYGGIELTKETVRELMCTPKAQGGLGINPRLGGNKYAVKLQAVYGSDIDDDMMVDGVERERFEWKRTGQLGAYAGKKNFVSSLLGKPVDELKDTTIRRKLGEQLAPKGAITSEEKIVDVVEEERLPILRVPPMVGGIYTDFTVKDEYKTLDMELLLENLPEQNKLDFLETLTHARSLGSFQIIRRKCTSRVLWLWLLGKWPKCVPVVLGQSSDVTSFISQQSRNAYFSHMLVKYNKIGFDLLKCYAANAECNSFVECIRFAKEYNIVGYLRCCLCFLLTLLYIGTHGKR